MPTGYRGQALTLPQMVDELTANGRSPNQAVQELRSALRDGALSLIDLHDPAWASDRLISAAIHLLDAFAAGARGFGAAPYGHAQYFRDGVVVLREHFEGVFRLDLAHGSTRLRPLESGIAAAIDELWPTGFPAGLRASDRNNQIKQYLLDHSYAGAASDGALERAVQRELKRRREQN